MTAEQFTQAQTSGAPVSPNDVLPFAEAAANPTFQKAAEASAAEIVAAVTNPMENIARIRILGANRRGETPSTEDMIMAQMDATKAEQFIQVQMIKMGIPHPGSAHLDR
jgi:hypothetical protein